jgi:uncharacterized membrane protein YhaH (DUF805 family)
LWAVTTKRLHDLSYSGWWLLLAAVVVIPAFSYAKGGTGGLLPGLIVLGSLRGVKGANRFGPEPHTG